LLGLPELRTFWWVIVCTGALLLGCAGTVEHVRYNPDTLLYEGTTLEDTSRAGRQGAWFAMRMPDTHELAEDISVAARLAQFVNSGRLLLEEIRVVPSTSVFRQYEAGQAYFQGVRALENQNYDHARNQFYRAIFLDPQLRYLSDVTYLLAQAESGRESKSAAITEFANFQNYSEGIYPESFYLGYEDTTSLLRQRRQMDFSEMSTGIPRHHFGKQYSGPAIAPRYYPGHLKHEIYGSGFTPYLGAGLDQDGQPYTSVTLHYYSRYGFELSLGRKFLSGDSDWYTEAAYQIFRSWDNKIGVTVDYQLELQARNHRQNPDLTFQQHSVSLQSGYFPTPRFGIYAGIKYYLYNEQSVYEYADAGDIVELWNRNNYFIGGTFFILDHVGLTSQWSRNNQFQFGVYFYGSSYFPRWLQF
jgi:hypothetical protein